jgi:hypothetical protein
MNLLTALLGVLYLLALAASAWGGWPAGPLPIDAYLAFFGGGLLVYAAIVAIVTQRALSAATLRWLMLVALLARAATLAGPHRVNSDVWRYLWDGHLLANGYNPFAHRPDDPALDAIRDPSIYARLNPAYNQLRTVYGPVAATVFALATRVPTSGDETIRVIMTIGDVTTIVLLWYLRFLLYPWFDSPNWPALTRLLETAAERMSEPWRVVEYALVLSTVAILAIWHRCRSRLASRADH